VPCCQKYTPTDWRFFPLSIFSMLYRRMFPALQVKFSGFVSSSKYVVLLDFTPVDQYRYKFEYDINRWMLACEEGTLCPTQVYTHPFSPQYGFEWCKNDISFIKCKLTNNYREDGGHVSVEIVFVLHGKKA